jgi:hypothetical protein
LVLPNWCASLHCASVSGSRWFRRYCRNVYQSRRFCDSYLLSCDGGGGSGAATGCWASPPTAEEDGVPAESMRLCTPGGRGLLERAIEQGEVVGPRAGGWMGWERWWESDVDGEVNLNLVKGTEVSFVKVIAGEGKQ